MARGLDGIIPGWIITLRQTNRMSARAAAAGSAARTPTPSSSLLSRWVEASDESEREVCWIFAYGFLAWVPFLCLNHVDYRERPVASLALFLANVCTHVCIVLWLGAFTVHLRRADECTCCKSWLNYTGGGADEPPSCYFLLCCKLHGKGGVFCAALICVWHTERETERVAFWQVHSRLVDIIITIMWVSSFSLYTFNSVWFVFDIDVKPRILAL
jgi:hypothetical protein